MKVQLKGGSSHFNVVEESANYYIVAGNADPATRMAKSKLDYEPVPTPAPVKIYTSGDRVWLKSRYNFNCEEYILAQVNTGIVALIHLKQGNRWSEPRKVANVTRVSTEEMQALIGSNADLVDTP